jgi:hypothetical protein
MTSRQDWIDIIRKNGGKVSSDGAENHRHPALKLSFADKYTWIDAFWIYRNPGDNKFKTVRDKIASEMRKDGWDISVGDTKNRLEYFFFAKKERVWVDKGGLLVDKTDGK